MNTQPQDAKHVPLTQADKLRQDAASAAEVRKWSQHPDVIALRVERIRTQLDVLIWIGICLGLAFTMVNVQTFAAAGALAWSLPWIAAWLLDPMVSLVLIAVLRAEQVTARWQVETGKWVNRTKWFAFGATYVMNTWQSYTALHVAGIVLHSVPPILVFLASETAPVLRDRLTESVTRAARMNAEFTEQFADDLAPKPAASVNTERENTGTAVAERDTPPDTRRDTSAGTTAVRAAARKPQPSKAKQGGRTSSAEYLATARRQLSRDTEVSPAWVREVTGCSRGLSSRLSRELAAEQAAMTDTENTAEHAASGVHDSAREAA